MIGVVKKTISNLKGWLGVPFISQKSVPIPPTEPVVPWNYRGCNLTGGDSFWREWNGGVPTDGVDYIFVGRADIDYLVSQGMDVFRLLFTWEALQRSPYGNVTASDYWKTFKDRVDYITKVKNCVCVIDIHGGADETFAAYYSCKIGTLYQDKKVSDLFENLWWQLASIFKDNPLVWFGLTNEPSNMDTTAWFNAAKQAIDGIRRTGAKNKILLPGVNFTNAGVWILNSGPAYDKSGIKDSNLAIQVHMYLDSNQGGGTTEIVSESVGVERLSNALGWAKARGLQVFLAEVGLSARNPLSGKAWGNIVKCIDANKNTIIGYTFWAYGPPKWWTFFRFSLCRQTNGLESPQMTLIKPSLQAAR